MNYNGAASLMEAEAKIYGTPGEIRPMRLRTQRFRKIKPKVFDRFGPHNTKLKSKMNKYIFFLAIFCAALFTSCGSKDTVRHNEESVSLVNRQPEVSTNHDYTPTSYENSESGTDTVGSSKFQAMRSQAFQDAFNYGKQIGYSDGMNGVNDGCTYASAYTDDWIRQAFLQGYEMGQAEAASKGGDSSYYIEEEEYESGEEYCYDDEY